MFLFANMAQIFSIFFDSGLQARPLFKDRRKFAKMADPLLQGRYPMRGLYQALAVAAMCLQEQGTTRPLIGDVVTALSYLASQTCDPNAVHGNRTGPSTPRSREDRNTQSPHKNSPNVRQKDPFRGTNFGAEVGRCDTCWDSGRKWDSEESDARSSHQDSPVHAGKSKRSTEGDLARERAIAEARVWGENWRERKRNEFGSFDGTNE